MRLRGLLALLLAFGLMLPAFGARALTVDANRLKDPAQEARAVRLMGEFRCLVCQNESIEDSDADLAADLRSIVRDRVRAGDTDAQVKAYLVARYGNWILLKPPFDARTAILWVGPFVLLIGGALFLVIRARRQTGEAPAAAALTPEEKKRLARILKDGEGRRS